MKNFTVTLDTGETHEVEVRPVDQFGYLAWAKPVLEVETIGDDYVAFSAYGVTRALIRTGRLERSDDVTMLDLITRLAAVSTVDESEDPTQPAA